MFKIKSFISFLLILTLLFTIIAGCAYVENLFSGTSSDPSDPPSSTDDPVTDSDTADLFDEFIDELYVEAITTSSISLNFNLADPSAFGIEDIIPTLGEVSTVETALEDREKSLKEAERLHSFDYALLRDDQKITFDILTRSYELNYTEEYVEDHLFYLGYIRPLNGIQIQLPILLAEINFRTKADFDMYFALLEDTQRYFSEIIEFERERSRRGFFLSAANVDDVVEHIESFLSNREENFLIPVINEIIDEFDGLTVEERNVYKQRNRDLVLNSFLPAYDKLLSAMKELRGVGARYGGLSNLPDGEEFAKVYLQHRTDSDLTPSEMLTILEEGLEDAQRQLWDILSGNPELLDMYLAGMLGNIPYDTPENYMKTLENAITRDFPPLGNVNVAIREVHESMQEHMSPAFYLSPAVDDFVDNVIYINPTKVEDNFTLFTALAHEGYPGHMYQFVYYRQQLPHPIRTLLCGIGYTEGWASYAEYASFYWAGLDEKEAELLKLIRIADLIFQSMIDLNVNVYGWDIYKLSEFLSEMGITDQNAIESIYNRVTGVPLFFLPYTIGYIELVALRDHAQSELRNKFVPLNFNKFILDFGPAPFSILREHLEKWIASEKAG